MKSTWVKGLYGDTRVFNNKYEIKHHNGNIVSFDSKEELNEYIEQYFLNQCDLSSDMLEVGMTDIETGIL
jgi:hypothetical protein